MAGKAGVMPTFDEHTGGLVGPGGEDYVIISAEALRRINKQEELMFGSGSFVIWYNAGKQVGRQDGKRLAPMTSTMELQDFAGHLRDTYSMYGWGFIEVGKVDLKTGEIAFRVTNSPLVRGLLSREPRCWFVRGFAEGLVSEIIGAEVVATELQCQAQGERYCD